MVKFVVWQAVQTSTASVVRSRCAENSENTVHSDWNFTQAASNEQEKLIPAKLADN